MGKKRTLSKSPETIGQPDNANARVSSLQADIDSRLEDVWQELDALKSSTEASSGTKKTVDSVIFSSTIGVELDKKELFKMFFQAIMSGVIAHPYRILSARNEEEKSKTKLEFKDVLDLVDVGLEVLAERFDQNS